ncbi:stage III sporulation protein AB [Agathobaculum sp. NTUH-O15-33]|uniref:stage III sporulation protein AB n=1 Tax=Agathobaculum sp. NTUH-O15-33 TaxID=3079302 RepID=UPI002958B3ED|nr:stage III sporulation protein AB [Agathobaculum sp. NTUH-O15-33]WNX83085.1 stage III sporulation protein AB [Agathobaculum sp. NTUH-O15-33]
MEMKKDEALRQALECMPPPLLTALTGSEAAGAVEEIRLRAGRPPAFKTVGGERETALEPLTPEILRDILSRAARYSVHSYQESLQNGFLTLPGGHRLGVCGTAIMEDREVRGIRQISSLNLRVARQIDTVGQDIRLTNGDRLVSTLLLSPPGAGKTTLLRELTRRVSDQGVTVAVADERSELAALSGGRPQFQIGSCTDVIEGCGKKQAAIMLLKTMSPALLVFDEITAPADVEAVSLCAHCGVAVFASAHARDVQDLSRRALYRKLLGLGLFRQAVVISVEGGERRYQTIPLKGG